MNEFDIKAAEWDKDPVHWELSVAIVGRIIKLVPIKKAMTVLEYGAGTGNSSFLLKDHLKEITLMDNSTEMVKVMKEKIKAAKVKNLKVLNFDLEQNDYKGGSFDLIFTQMVLHHVTDTDLIIHKFSKLLNPGGYLAIADLYKEDGSFHGSGFTGHNGFDPDRMTDIVRSNNFIDISYNPCFTINKNLSETDTRKFDIFLLTAHLPVK